MKTHKYAFTDEQDAALRENPNTGLVTSATVRFTDDFKRRFLDEQNNGKSARRIFRENGIVPEWLGDSRICGFRHSMNLYAERIGFERTEEYRLNAGVTEG